MFTSEIVFIIIVAACALIFVVAMFKIFKKKPKGAKKPSKSVKTDVGGMPKADVSKSETVKTDKMKSNSLKINKEKLKKIEDESANVTPVFSKEELESERIEQIHKDIEKDLTNQKHQPMFPGFNPQGFNFPSPQPRPTQPQMPVSKPQENHEFIPQTISIPVEAKEEDKDFVEMLKNRGIVKQNQSFGESLMIKEAIDTPASKKDMKKKRQKWI